MPNIPAQSTIIGRNQTAIPATIRKQFNLRQGDTLMWPNGTQSPRVVPVPADPLQALYGHGKGENLSAQLQHKRISMQIVDVDVDVDDLQAKAPLRNRNITAKPPDNPSHTA